MARQFTGPAPGRAEIGWQTRPALLARWQPVTLQDADDAAARLLSLSGIYRRQALDILLAIRASIRRTNP
ncbi:hypothetical protein EMIT0P201_11986 [Pseudomonas chlororaphis]